MLSDQPAPARSGLLTGPLQKRPLVVLALLAVALLLAVHAYLTRPVSVAVQQVALGPLSQSVVVTATAQTPHRASIGAQIGGQIRAVLVAEGDVVSAGDVLIHLDDREALSAVESAGQSLRQAHLKWAEWHDVIEPQSLLTQRQAQATVSQLAAQYVRLQALHERGFIGQAALDEALRAVDVSLAQAGVADVQRRASQSGGLAQRLAESALGQARSALDAAQARLSYTTLRAPFAGRVISRLSEPGDMAQLGKTLLILAPMTGVELLAQVDERHLPLLREGLLARASADAFADQPFEASVASISPGVDPQRGAVQVKLTVLQDLPFIRQDMTVSVEIQTAHKAQTIVIARDALHEDAGAAPWVWVLDADSRLVKTTVKTGLRESDRVEVLAGLRAGDRIVIEQRAGLRPGQRVRQAAS